MLRNQCGKRRYSCQIVPLSKRFPVRLPRRQVFEEIRHLASPVMPFVNLPDTHKSRWGDELTAEKMKECVWLRPEAVARIEFWIGPRQIGSGIQSLRGYEKTRIHEMWSKRREPMVPGHNAIHATILKYVFSKRTNVHSRSRRLSVRTNRRDDSGGATRFKLFQVFFGRDGSLFVTFSYFGHRTGILAAVTIPGNGQNTSQVNLQVGGKIASHLVKYSHHPDGRAHFSQTGKVRTEIKRQSVALNVQHGHIFSLLVQGLNAFDKADDTKDVGSSPKRTALTFQVAGSAEIGAIKFVGRWLDVSKIVAAGSSAIVGPTLLTQDSAGNQRNGVLVASRYDHEPRHVLCITSEPVPRLGPDPEMMCFYGGFAPREVMDDTAQ